MVPSSLCPVLFQVMGKLMETEHISVFNLWLLAKGVAHIYTYLNQRFPSIIPPQNKRTPWCPPPQGGLFFSSSSPFPFSHPTSWHGASSQQLGLLPTSPRHKCNCWEHARQLSGISSTTPPPWPPSLTTLPIPSAAWLPTSLLGHPKSVVAQTKAWQHLFFHPTLCKCSDGGAFLHLSCHILLAAK